jgi:hypothetical protein
MSPAILKTQKKYPDFLVTRAKKSGLEYLEKKGHAKGKGHDKDHPGRGKAVGHHKGHDHGDDAENDQDRSNDKARKNTENNKPPVQKAKGRKPKMQNGQG